VHDGQSLVFKNITYAPGNQACAFSILPAPSRLLLRTIITDVLGCFDCLRRTAHTCKLLFRTCAAWPSSPHAPVTSRARCSCRPALYS
jgi:hypothetical protein